MTGVERALAVYREDEPDLGIRSVWLRRTAEGELALEGQDLGRGVSSAFGDAWTEYEWTFTLARDRVPRLLGALGVEREPNDAFERVAERLSTMAPREMQLAFEGAGATFWSRIGD